MALRAIYFRAILLRDPVGRCKMSAKITTEAHQGYRDGEQILKSKPNIF